MRDHEVYAHAFVASGGSDSVKKYLEFKKCVEVFQDSQGFIDTLLFNRQVFNDFRSEFKDSFSPLVFNFLDILVQDGLIEQIFNVEMAIRDELVKQELYNYCVIESAEALSSNFDKQLVDMILKRTDNNVEIVKKVNPSLKSGVRIYLNNESIDLSIIGRLQRLLSEVS